MVLGLDTATPGAVLGLDTATPATAVALLAADGTVRERRHDPVGGERPGHQPRLLTLVDELLGPDGWTGVRRLAVGVGPGGFTGLRIGVATARALAQARGIELVGVSSLRALALPALDAGRPVLAAIDARRGEVFAAAYASDGTELAPPAALGPDALAALARRIGAADIKADRGRSDDQYPPLDPTGRAAALAIGDGAIAFRDSLQAAGAHVAPDDDPAHKLLAASVCRLGAQASPDGAPPLPDYRREPDAQARPTP